MWRAEPRPGYDTSPTGTFPETATPMRRAIALSIIDQALLSAFSLGLSLLLIARVSPSEFGAFSYVLAVLIILSSLRNALVAAPLGVSVPGRPAREQEETLAILLKVDHALRIALLPVAALMIAVANTDPLHLLSALALCFVWLWRETQRDLAFTLRLAERALMLDAVSVGTSIVAILILWRVLPPVPAVLAGLAAGNALGIALAGQRHALLPFAEALAGYRRFWHDGRWGLFGTVTTEAQYRGYVFAVQGFRGADALGAVQAGRALMGPLPLLASAWARVARPEMTIALVENRVADARRTLLLGVAGVLVLSLLYLLVLYFAWALVETHLFKGRYPEIAMLTLVWGLTTLISTSDVCFSAYLQAARQFRPLAFASLAAALVSGSALLVIATTGPVTYTVGAVALGEIVSLAWVLVLIARAPAVAPNPEAATS